MFERFTEQARRILFFARYEASQFGHLSIEPEHILLGVIREGKGAVIGICNRAHLSAADLRTDLEAHLVAAAEKVSTSVEIPFSAGSKRVLRFAADEADGLTHKHIGSE